MKTHWTPADHAETGAAMVACHPDFPAIARGDLDMLTIVRDAVADLHHFCDREGLEFGDVIRWAEVTYQGDAEDGPYNTPIDKEIRNAA